MRCFVFEKNKIENMVRVYEISSYINIFKLYLLENEVLKGKISFYIFHLFSHA